MTDVIRFASDNNIGLITLDRTSALNALNFPMILALDEQLHAWRNDDAIHAVVICSAGGRAFCAGGDVRAIYQLGRDNQTDAMAFFKAEYRLNQLIHEFDKPYIALMDGITMGGGVGISLHGSHPVASTRFVFAMPETGIGFFPDIGASFLLSRCPNHFGTYLGLTGARIDARDAHALGLVKHVISTEQFPSILTRLQGADLSTDAHQQVTEILQSISEPRDASNIDAMRTSVDACFQYEDIDAILRALQEQNDDWSKEVLQVLAQKAPLSLKVTLVQLQKAVLMTLADCLQMDDGLTSHFLGAFDFYEGVRALLIDKDNAPNWHPSTLDDVSHAQVAAYFE